MEALTQRCLSLIAACAAVVCAGPVHAQFLEFAGAEWRGRIDRPTSDNMWTVGDTNGNGIVDEGETFGTRVNVAEALLAEPDTDFVMPTPTLALPSAPLVFGFIDIVQSDIDSDGGFGSAGYGREDPGRHPDVIFGPNPAGDFENIVRLPSPFSFLGNDAYARYGGTQLMHVFRFESGPEFTLTAANESLEIAYGARYLSSWQDQRIVGSGGTLDKLLINSSLESDLLGPQVSVRWAVRRGRWRLHAEAAAAVTYMEIDGDQLAQLGEDSPPPQLNRGLYSRPAKSNRTLSEWDVAPVLEAGLLGAYDITPSTLCFIRCDAIQFGNVRAIENTLVYDLPRFGFRDPGGSDKTITSASVGFELRR